METIHEVQPGDSLEITAAEWNSVRRMARWYEFERPLELSAGRPSCTLYPALEVRVYNATASDVDAGGILAVTAATAEFPAFPREAAANPVLNGDTPASIVDPIIILSEPVKTHQYGRGVLAGVAVCTVTIGDANHKFANPTPANSAKLTSAAEGSVRILDRESAGTGDKLCLVLIQAWSVGEIVCLVKCTSNTVDGGTGTQPGVIRKKDGAGGRSDGATVRMKPTSGDKFRNGKEYDLYLNGTATVSAVTYLLFDGRASTAYEYPVCRSGSTQTDRAWMAEPWDIEENV